MQLQYPFLFTVDTLEIDWLMFDRITVFLLLSLTGFSMLFIAFTIWQIEYTIRSSIKKLNSTLIVSAVIVIAYAVCLSIPDWKLVDLFFQWNSYLRFYVSIVTPAIIYTLGRMHQKRIKRELKPL